jgi:hypothetical protein
VVEKFWHDRHRQYTGNKKSAGTARDGDGLVLDYIQHPGLTEFGLSHPNHRLV